MDENGNKKSTLSLVQTNMGDVGTMTWSDPSVSAVNNFKNAFIGQSECVSSSDSVVYIERGTTGIAVVYNTDTVPSVKLSIQGGTISSDTITVTIDLVNAVSGTYSFDDGKVYSFTGQAIVTLGENTEYGGHTKLTITATDGDLTYTYKHIYNKNKNEHEAQTYDESTGKYNIYMKNTANWEDVYCYMWVDESTHNQDWPGLKMTDLGNGIFLYSTDEEYPNVIFTDGNGTQTADLIWKGNDYIFYNKENEWKER